LLDVTKAENGLLKISITKKGDAKALVEEFFVYDTKKSITGFSLFESNSTLTYSGFIIIIFLIFAFLIVRRMIVFNKEQSGLHVSNTNKNVVSSRFKKFFEDLYAKAKKGEESIMVVDKKFVDFLKSYAKGKDLKGKWININLDKQGQIRGDNPCEKSQADDSRDSRGSNNSDNSNNDDIPKFDW
jgi:hypothetical protein